MSLEVDLITVVAILAAPTKEMIEADFIKRRGGSKRRDVPAETIGLAVGSHDHGHRVPANDALDTAFDLAVAGIRWLLVDRDRVDIRRVQRRRTIDAGSASLDHER